MVAGNFDGNDAGREQILCVTGLEKYYYQYESYSKLYCIYNTGGGTNEDGSVTEDSWACSETGNYLFKSKKPCYITVAATDTGDDSTIVTLNRVDRTYSEPGVLAVLEAPPYFREIGDGDTGNSQTVYGTTSTSGSGYSNNVGFSAGITFGYEADTLLGGGGWEVTIDNSFNWGFANTTEVSFFTNFANDTGDNLVVVYRSPVVGYEYLDQDGNALTITKTGLPAVNMIPVEDYNEAVAQYTSKNLDPIPDGLLSSPGDPQSYRSTTEGLDEAVEGSSDSNPSWIQYSGQGTVEQSVETTQTSENDFTYELDIQGSLWGKVFGGKLGGQAGVQYSHGISWSSGQGALMSGSVTGQQENGYDFQWRFATWTTQLNGSDVPVLGYLVRDVVAPPSPGANLQVSHVSETTATITWEPGTRSSQQYRIYRLTDDGVYVLVSAVSGSTYEYTLSGLLPGEPYTYVVRGVAYEEDGDEQESVDSSRLTVMTRSENAADVEILLFGAQDNGSYPTSGAEVNLSVEAIVTANYQYNTSYQWQILRPDNWKDGISNWTNLSANEEGIESVEVDKNSLRLTGLDSSLDGARLRCRVTVPTSDATPNDYYSDAVTLEISLDSTETSLSLSGSADDRAAGSLDDPYTGNAGYSITTTTSTPGEVEQDVAIPAGESHPALKVYSYTAGEESTPVYVGVGTDEGETVYYAVTKTETSEGGAAYSVGDKLTLGGTKWVTAAASGSGTEEYTVPEGYDGTIETDPSTGYRRMALVKTADGSTTFTEYWMSVPAGDEETAVQYFTKEDGGTFKIVTLTENEEEALRYVYVGSGEGVLIVNAAEEGSDGPGADDDRYVTYAVSGGALSAPTVFWGEADTGLYATNGEGQKTLYAGSTGLTVERETVTQEQTGTTTASYGGTEITVAAKTTVDTSILFTFANLTTGGSESVQAGADGRATWQAAVPGMYRVTATAQATETAASSTSAALYYYAGSVSEGATTEYRLVVSKGSAPASSMVYDGSSVALTLQSRTAATANGGTVTSPSGSWQDVEDNVSYTVLNLSGSDEDAAAIEGSAYYRPQAAGTYRFTASLGGVQVATAQLEVARADITIAPAWEGMEDETVPAALDEIQLTASGGFLEEDQALLERAMAVQCGLYGSDGAIRDVGGVYDVTLSYKSDEEGIAAAAELQSKYNVTLASGEITNLSHSAVVNYSAGENGTLQAQYVENSEYGFVSGASIPVGYGLRFVATPAVGFQFAEWTVTLNGTAVAWKDEALQGIVTFTKTESAAILRVSSLEALIQAVQGESEGSGEDAAPVLQVQAAFTSQNRTVTFSADESTPNGTVTAQQDGQSLNSGVSVTITAQPETGYEVASWSVNGERIENTQGQNTFTYTSQSANTGAAISVEFQQVTYAVSWSAAGGTVTADGYTGTSADIRGGTEVSFTAEPAYGYELTGWTVNGEPQNGESDETFTWTVPNGQAADPAASSYQIEALFELVDTDYTLTYTVAGSGGTISVPGGENGSVTVSHGGSITFTAAPDQYYHVNEWMVDGEPVTEGVSADRTTLTLTNVTAAHTIAVSFTGAVRYDVNYAVEGSGGTVSATANGESIASDTTVQVLGGSKLVFTAAPEEGYMVARWTVNGEEVTRGNMAAYGMTSPYQNTLTVENLTSALTVRVFFEVYNGYLIPENGAGYTITGVVRTPGETYEGAPTNEIRKGGDVTFTVGLNVEGGYANFSKLVINGYDCLEQTGTAAGCDSVTATRNSDGSYTVTIQNVRGNIDADIEAHQLVIDEGLEDYDIPDSLKNLEIDTPEEIQTLLSTAITGSYDGITYMDIALMYWDGSQWVVVTEMPEGGVDVVVPYDTINEEATSNDTFTVAHMLTTGENAGQVDIIEDVRKESDGLHFHVDSLSPFAISWTKYEAPVTPGGGGGTPSEPEEPTWPFTDVTGGEDWFYDAVAYVYENGIMAGTDETIFEPYMELDRTQAAQLFYNLEGKPAVTGDSTFTDVTSGHWAVDAITWAAQNDIVAGIGGGLYDLDSNVTREQFAVMLYKYARFKGYDLTATGDLTQFPDMDAISGWAETALSWANGNGLINGNEDGTIDPKGSTIRAQAASILAHFDQSFANK